MNHEVHLEESQHNQKKKELEKKEHLVFENEDQPNQSEYAVPIGGVKKEVVVVLVPSGTLGVVSTLNSDKVPKDAPITRRFGLLQKKGKVRLIDDYTASGVNGCVTTHESPILHTVDIACALISTWFSESAASDCSVDLQVRTFDLKSAYRQVGLSQAGRSMAFIQVYNPETQQLSYFQSAVLPFGAVRSVHSFLRLSRALWWLGVVGCALLWTSFYDDFICYSPAQLARSAEQTIDALFKMTGWLYAESGDKCHPFGSACEALGVVFDVSQSANGYMLVKNTDSRIAELQEELNAVITSRKISPKAAQRLRGRMQFAESQLFGKTGKRCLKVLSDFAEMVRWSINDKDVLFLEMFRDMLTSSPPKKVCAIPKGNTLIFTDACYERDDKLWPCGIGGVLMGPGLPNMFFSVGLDDEARNLLGEAFRKQIIFEAETLAALLHCCSGVNRWLEHIRFSLLTMKVQNIL